MANTLEVEQHGLNVIPESERHGKPRDQFWPWAASNVSIYGISMAAWIMTGLAFGQAVLAGIVGIVFSFALVGVIALAGKRGSAPTLVLSRAAFGFHGNKVPTLVSYLLLVGWETVLVALGVLATETVLKKLEIANGDIVKIVAFVVIVGIVILSGIFGFKFIMKIQKWITLASIALTVVFIALSANSINLEKIFAVKDGSFAQLTAAAILTFVSFGLGWVNGGADYSRYLPRTASSRGIFGWTTLGASIAPAILVIYGFMLAMSNDAVAANIGNDPVGALTAVLPTWFLIPFIVLALLGFMGGAILDIYSSGLNLLTLGLKVKRPVAAAIDGVLMLLGTVYIIWLSQEGFFDIFKGFLYTIGVPMAAWAGIFIADLLLRKKSYDEAALYSARGRYGAVNLAGLITFALGTALGWGFVTNGVAGLDWQGYIFRFIGVTDVNPWYWSNVGIFFALVLAFVGYFLIGGPKVRKQEA